MASSALTGSLHKFLKAGPLVVRGPSGLRALVTGAPGTPEPFEGADAQMKDASAPIIGESAASESRGMASAAAAQAHEEIDEADSTTIQMIGKAQDMSEKAKQSVQGAWDSAKETAHKMKESVIGISEDAKECIEERVDDIKASSNSVKPEDYPRQF